QEGRYLTTSTFNLRMASGPPAVLDRPPLHLIPSDGEGDARDRDHPPPRRHPGQSHRWRLPARRISSRRPTGRGRRGRPSGPAQPGQSWPPSSGFRLASLLSVQVLDALGDPGGGGRTTEVMVEPLEDPAVVVDLVGL